MHIQFKPARVDEGIGASELIFYGETKELRELTSRMSSIANRDLEKNAGVARLDWSQQNVYFKGVRVTIVLDSHNPPTIKRLDTHTLIAMLIVGFCIIITCIAYILG